MATDAKIRELAVAFRDIHGRYFQDMGRYHVDYDMRRKAFFSALDEPRDPDPAQAKLEALEGKVRVAEAEARVAHQEHGYIWPCESSFCPMVRPGFRALIAAVEPPKPPEPKFKVGDWVTVGSNKEIAYRISEVIEDAELLGGYCYVMQGAQYCAEVLSLTDEEIRPRP